MSKKRHSKKSTVKQIKTGQTKTKPGNIYDAFVKNIFGRIMVFVDFLLNYADPKFVNEIDLNKIYPAPTHYVGLKGDERILDLIFCCPLKNGRANTKAIIVFEHISSSLRELPIKLQAYASAVWMSEIKAGQKVLSALYFIVLRTGKKPIRRCLPRLADRLPKDKDGNPIGAVPEIKYDVVDLPEFDLETLRGGAVLRLGMGILKKMTEGTEEEFPEALQPLLEIDNEKQQIELTKEIFEFVAKAMAAHNKRLDAEQVHQALKPIFRERERTMITTIFEEKYLEGKAEGVAEGEAKGKAAAVMSVLRKRFTKVPKQVEISVSRMRDPVALESLVGDAAICKSLADFAKCLK
jgi:hypothetical protein